MSSKERKKTIASTSIFDDRRQQLDRRSSNNLFISSIADCRREDQRRDICKRFGGKPWWLQATYVNEEPLSKLSISFD